MNENINLCEILKDCPKGMKFWSPILGKVEFICVKNESIKVYEPTREYYGFFTANGNFDFGADWRSEECLLFPSENQRDWSKWKCPKPKFDPKTLKAFDRVLARMDESHACYWFADFVSEPANENKPTICLMGCDYPPMIIPYNDDTKHLVGTSEEAPEFYRYWED